MTTENLPPVVGGKMMAAWEYLSERLDVTDYEIRVQFGRRVADRLIRAGMASSFVDQNGATRLNALQGWVGRKPGSGTRTKSPERARAREQRGSTLKDQKLLIVECPTCKSQPGQPCRSRLKTRLGEVINPHYGRLLAWITHVSTKYPDLDI